jgi:hypothetical protein
MCRREIEFDHEVVARSRQRLTVCEQFHDVTPYDGDLRVRIAWLAPVPLVSGHSFFQCQTHQVQGLMNTGRAAAHDERQPSSLTRRRCQRRKTPLQLRK